MRQVTHEICEMKRLYVRPQAQGRHLGRALAERLIEEARTVGYSEMRLDVQAKFVPARKLYETLGFVAAEPISFNPVPGASLDRKSVVSGKSVSVRVDRGGRWLIQKQKT